MLAYLIYKHLNALKCLLTLEWLAKEILLMVYHQELKQTLHIPPTTPFHDCSMSTVEGYTFTKLRSMQNIQSLLYSPG